MSLADEILAADDLEKVPVSLTKWTDKPLFVRTMTGAERDAFEYQCFANKDNPAALSQNIRARIVAICLVDENGERVFSDSHIEALGRKAAKELDTAYEAAATLNGLREKDIEELAGN